MKKEDKHARDLNANVIPGGIPGGFFIYNALGDEELYFVDRNVVRIFGCDDADDFRRHTGGSFRGMVHPDDLDRVEESIRAQTFISGKRHDYVRYRILTKQGECRYVEDFGHLMTGDDGSKYFCVSIFEVR